MTLHSKRMLAVTLLVIGAFIYIAVSIVAALENKKRVLTPGILILLMVAVVLGWKFLHLSKGIDAWSKEIIIDPASGPFAVPIHFDEPIVPERINLFFKDSAGFYRGNISLVVNSKSKLIFTLPKRREYVFKPMRMWNNSLVRGLGQLSYQWDIESGPLQDMELQFDLNRNVTDSFLVEMFKRQKVDVTKCMIDIVIKKKVAS